MLTSETKEDWRNNGKQYAAGMKIFRMPEKVGEIIEKL